MRKIIHLFEAALLLLLFGFLRLLPLDMASALGGFLGRSVGPLFSAHKTAIKNLATVFPEKSDSERAQILLRMWDNLGRVAAELPHLPTQKLLHRATLYGLENLPTKEVPSLFFSGHIGNWEMLPGIPYHQGAGITIVYRHANNLYVDAIISKLRSSQCNNMVAKGPRGAFKLAKVIKNKESICMLVDQKMNDGISVPLFGREAMTAPAIAQLSLRYNLPIIPARVVRKKGANFDVHIYPPLVYEKTGDDEKDIMMLMLRINGLLESWIREYPEQWFWVHKRWPKE